MSSAPRGTHAAHRMEGLTSHAFLVSVTGTRAAAILRLAYVITVHTTPQVVFIGSIYRVNIARFIMAWFAQLVCVCLFPFPSNSFINI